MAKLDVFNHLLAERMWFVEWWMHIDERECFELFFVCWWKSCGAGE